MEWPCFVMGPGFVKADFGGAALQQETRSRVCAFDAAARLIFLLCLGRDDDRAAQSWD
jgi:hypothetical protein